MVGAKFIELLSKFISHGTIAEEIPTERNGDKDGLVSARTIVANLALNHSARSAPRPWRPGDDHRRLRFSGTGVLRRELFRAPHVLDSLFRD